MVQPLLGDVINMDDIVHTNDDDDWWEQCQLVSSLGLWFSGGAQKRKIVKLLCCSSVSVIKFKSGNMEHICISTQFLGSRRRSTCVEEQEEFC